MILQRRIDWWGVLVVSIFLVWVLYVGFADAHPFGGKFELVPLYDAGHRPVIRNGHQDYASRNTTTFRTNAGDVVTVFAGETTDLASIPSVLWPILPPDGPWAQAAIYHDACYRTHGSFVWSGRVGIAARGTAGPIPFTRAGCDEILREAMVALGVPDWKRIAIWSAVRAFGGAGWGH